ncbi:GrpB family protein [Deinococcus sp.]|uniref:GrpB family protein n=1 Tax=Deinococcus sp. TaxID=47478 RepID=UPI003C7D88B2
MTEAAPDLGLRLQDGELRLSEYHPGWAEAFRQEAARLLPFLHEGSELEHVGSTAVPGLIAKPVLDLAVKLATPLTVAAFEADLPGLGYRFHLDGGESRGRIWRKGPGGLCTHILHLVLSGNPQWERWLALRDLLRRSGEERQRYAEAKAQALLQATSRQEYTRLKTGTIQRLLSEC